MDVKEKLLNIFIPVWVVSVVVASCYGIMRSHTEFNITQAEYKYHAGTIALLKTQLDYVLDKD